eukprot:768221-Hanusia_phi.AAC.7
MGKVSDSRGAYQGWGSTPYHDQGEFVLLTRWVMIALTERDRVVRSRGSVWGINDTLIPRKGG